MTGIIALWLPIVLSAVLVFFASSVIHMLSPWHKSDYPPLPDEDGFRQALKSVDLPPGDYMVPRVSSRSELQSPEFLAKLNEGPNIIMTVLPKGMMKMSTNLIQWFIYLLAVSAVAAYVAGRALGPGAEYLAVFRFAGTAAFLGYSFALFQMSIWYRRSWAVTIKSAADGLIYAMLTAGMMGWLWPR